MTDTNSRRPHLNSPTQLGALQLRNRVVMAPLTRSRADAGDVPGALMVEYYRQRAGAGMIITEGAQVSPQGKGYPGTPGIYNAEQVAGWRQVTDAVHAAGGTVVLQLWHVGRASHPSVQLNAALPVAPSAIQPSGQIFTETGLQPFVTPRALEESELAGVVDSYRTAARHARDAGFDGVEVHGANGYLLDQFLRDGSNQRTDGYGGPVQNRARLLLEVVDAVCGVWGADRVGVRLSPNNPFGDMRDSDPMATFGHVIRALDERGLAYLHMVEGEAGLAEVDPDVPHADILSLRQLWHGAYLANDRYTGELAEEALASGYAQAVSFGKAFIANPDLPARLVQGAPLNTPDTSTFYGGGAKGYTDYPALAA